MARSSLSRRLPVLLLLPCCRLWGRGAQWLATKAWVLLPQASLSSAYRFPTSL